MHTKISQKQYKDFIDCFFVEKLKDGSIRFGQLFLVKFPEIANAIMGTLPESIVWTSRNDTKTSAYIKQLFVED